MDPTQDLELEAPTRAADRPARDPLLRRLADQSVRQLRPHGEKTVLWLHRQADRMDLVPPDFGEERPVDRDNAESLVKEWIRQARLWAGYNPEQVLALKAGAVALGVALMVLIILVGAIR
jgi:hypothetical protein